MSKRQDLALMLARHGFRIFPLLPGSKLPYSGEGWKAIMTTDEARIRHWFETRPDMNYAVVCGEDHVILDPDEGFARNGRKKQGVLEFRKAEDAALGFVEDSIFDQTFRVVTPKGGSHLYFTCQHGYSNSVGSIIPDVDVRGPDGYVVGPASWTADDPENNTAEGTYQIVTDGDMAALPSWLERLLETGGRVGKRAENAGTAAHPVDTKAAVEQATRVLKGRAPAIQGEHGDDQTVATARALKDYGVSQDTCFNLMYHKILFSPDQHHPLGRTWNETCEPEWSEEGMRDKVANAYRYGNYQIGSKMDALAAFSEEEECAMPAVDGMDEMQAKLAPGEHYSAISQPIGTDDNASRAEAALSPFSEFNSKEMHVSSIIREWIPATGVTAVLAKRGTGKSVWITDFACRVATDMPWNGTQPEPDWCIVYLCGEDTTGLQRNLRAWEAHYGKTPADDRFWIADRVPNLMDAEDVKAWADALRKRFKNRKVVVIVDTWQRATSTASQNDDKEMQKAIHQAEGLARSLDGCAIIAFHPPKNRDDTITGSAVLENSTTAILTITSTGGTERHIEVTRIKGPGEGHYAKFNIESGFFGMMDSQGNEVSGALALYKGGNKQGPAQEKFEIEETVRKLIADLMATTLMERKSGVSLKEVSVVLARVIMNNPEGPIGVYFNRMKRPEDIYKMLPTLFHALTTVSLGGGAFVRVVKEHLKIGD